MDNLFYAIVIAYLTVAMVMDLLWRRVKNWWILFGYALSIFFYIQNKQSLSSFLLGFIFPLPLIIFYKFRMIGAGDIKLLSVAGCILGFNFLLTCLIPMGIFAVILSVFAIIQSLPSFLNKSYCTKKVPLVVAISLGITARILGGYFYGK